MSRQRAAAFVPGHVTAFFSAHPDERPAAAGSRGAGVTLTDGVTVRVSAADATASTAARTIDGDPGTIGAAEDVLSALGFSRSENSGSEGITDCNSEELADGSGVALAVESDLPIGAGFGVSGAAALGTAIAANEAFDCGRSENELIRIAHEAEVSRGTGLGDVVAQARGGIPIRLEPGAPGIGELDGIPSRTRVEYTTFGELSTEAVLGGDTTALSAAGERALDRLRSDPRLPTLMAAARAFAVEADLLVPEVAEAIEAVEVAADGDVDGAAMAMLGRTVFALGTGLSDAGYDPTVCHTHPSGARLVEQ